MYTELEVSSFQGCTVQYMYLPLSPFCPQLHDQRRAQPHAPSPSQALRPGALYPNPRVLQSNASIEAAWATEPELSAPGAKLAELREPLLPGGETREEEGGTGLVAAGQQQRSQARDETVIKMHEEGSSGEQ